MTENGSLFTSIKNSLRNSNEWLFWLCLIWTTTFMLMFYVNFLNPEYKINPVIHYAYWPLVIAYTAHKETHRWTGSKLTIARPGELMVYMWWVNALIMYVIEFFTRGRFIYNDELNLVCEFVAIIFFGNTMSKLLHEQRNGDSKTQPGG